MDLVIYKEHHLPDVARQSKPDECSTNSANHSLRLDIPDPKNPRAVFYPVKIVKCSFVVVVFKLKTSPILW